MIPVLPTVAINHQIHNFWQIGDFWLMSAILNKIRLATLNDSIGFTVIFTFEVSKSIDLISVPTDLVLGFRSRFEFYRTGFEIYRSHFEFCTLNR